MKKIKTVYINRLWCKGCGICAAFCPKQALEIDKDEKACWTHPEVCIKCGRCELRCPDIAIEIK